MSSVCIISGSHRPSGSSNRVTVRLAELIARHIPENSTNFISLTDIPFWDEGQWGDEALVDKWKVWEPIADALNAADSLIVVSPEYSGMVPPRLTNFLLLCSGPLIGHKPALAVGVSSATGGAYPIAQLRSYSCKNNHLCWIPDHLIVRDINPQRDLFRDDTREGRRALYCLKLLDAYATALKLVRNSGVVDHKNFPYGM